MGANIKIPRRIRNLLACVLSAALYIVAVAYGDEPPEVIVHPDVDQQILSKNALRSIFGMRLRAWPDGTAVIVFVLPDDNPLHIAFSKETLNVFPHQLRYAWDRLVFSGTGQAPTEVSSEEEMRSKVASTPGAIGYLRRSMLDESVHVQQIK